MAPAATLSDPEYEMVKHVIDIKVLESLSLTQCSLAQCSIYKVPDNLRKVNKESYTPQLISIGPIHLKNEELKPMQEHKLRYFYFFNHRVSNSNQLQAMKSYKDYLENKEQDIRQCYADKFPDITRNEFVETMLLDSVFIMELLLRHSSWKHSDDYILSQAWHSRIITRDLILLENQIPFFVLKELYDTVVPSDNKRKQHSGFLDLAIEYFSFYDIQRSSSHETKLVLDQSEKYFYMSDAPGDNKKKASSEDGNNKSSSQDEGPKHFTDLIRCFYLCADLGKSDSCSNNVPLPRTATKLQESGVTFEKVEKRRLLDIKFDKNPFLSHFLCLGCLPYLKHFKARLRIPQLKVDHNTECVLRNLIALEQCHYYKEQPYICNYVSLMDSLIHTKDDVGLLVEEEVIVHELGSDKEVATLVNGLCKHVVVNSTCYCGKINDLNKHYQNVWNRTMAALWLVYFRDPWRASSTLVGIVFLLSTAFNLVRAIKFVF